MRFAGPNKLPLLILGLIFVGCTTLPGGKEAFIVIPRSMEISMGQQSYAEVLKKEKISTNTRWTAMLQRVGKRIAEQTPVSDFQWEFNLIQSKEMNAFCLPGGKVAVYEGIMPVLENEAALAVVLGHEVGHAVARHGVQRMSQELGTQVLLMGTEAFVLKDSPNKNIYMAALGVGTQVGVTLPFSRSNESEADAMGLEYAAAAGYDPNEAVRFWERFSKATAAAGSKPPEFLSTHPADETRIRELKRLIPGVMPVYEKSKQVGIGEKI